LAVRAPRTRAGAEVIASNFQPIFAAAAWLEQKIRRSEVLQSADHRANDPSLTKASDLTRQQHPISSRS